MPIQTNPDRAFDPAAGLACEPSRMRRRLGVAERERQILDGAIGFFAQNGFGAQLRDLQHIMALVLNALFFLSPVFIQRAVLDSGQLIILKYTNPVVPLLDLFRDPLIHGTMWREDSFVTVAIWTTALWLVAGVVSLRAGRKVVFAL